MRLQAADALMRLQRTLKPLTLRSVGGYRILVKITVMPDLVPACEYRLYRFWVGFKAPPGNEVEKGPRDDRWYLNLMAPNTKGDKFAWLDPTSIYINDAAFSDLVDDLMNDLAGVEYDVVAGLDAMGFVLGAALAARSNTGFLPIRKAGKLCVDTDSVSFGNYSGRTQNMEMRTPAFAPGTRVLLADQWVETGGTMQGAINLVERQQGVVAGLVAVAIEDNEQTTAYRTTYPCASAVVPGSRWQTECNAQSLSSFESYDPTPYFHASGLRVKPDSCQARGLRSRAIQQLR